MFPQAIMETAFTRVILPMPIFVLPPIIMSYLERWVQKHTAAALFSFFYIYNIPIFFINQKIDKIKSFPAAE